MLKETFKMNYLAMAVLTLNICVLYITVALLWNKDWPEYIVAFNRSYEQQNVSKCFKIMWNRSTFSDFIENSTIKNGGNISTYRENSCKHFIQLSSPGGRIGNQLFQTAALFGISFKNDFIPLVKPSFPLLKYFDLPNVFLAKLKKMTTCTPPHPAIFFKCSNKTFNMTIHGYFQSWKYFKNSADIIRTIFKIRPKYLQRAKLFLDFHSKYGLKNICIHVRRGDMNTRLYVRKGIAVADVNFIYKAIQFCKFNFKKGIFFVLSDDIKWCKENVKRNVIFSHFKEPGYDLALMSLCDHVVVTIGSFGWWGAWLSNGTAVYFNGYPIPGSPNDLRFSREDYYPPNWIGLS